MKEAGRESRGEEKRGSFSPGPEDEMGEKKEGELGDVRERQADV